MNERTRRRTPEAAAVAAARDSTPLRARMSRGSIALPVLIAFATAAPAPAARAEKQDSPGRNAFDATGLELVLRSTATGETDARVARLAALRVPAGQPPSPFLAAGPFEATLNGAIEVDLNDRYRFRLLGAGSAELLVDGEVVLGPAELPANGGTLETEREVPLRKGRNPVELRFRSPASGTAAVRLEWSGYDLASEPVPPTSLWRRSASPIIERGAARRRGRRSVAARMCTRCHQAAAGSGPIDNGMPELAAMAPILDGIGSRLHPRWIEQWLLGDPANGTHSPRLLSFDVAKARRQAADLAAYLASTASSDTSPPAPVSANPLDAAEFGRRLYREIGCAACHGDDTFRSADGIGRTVPLDEKWRSEALARYLLDPAAFDPWTEMPGMGLEPPEAAALARYLLAMTEDRGTAPNDPASRADLAPRATAGDPERGRRLARELRCRSCHELAGDDPPPAAAPLDQLAGGDRVWTLEPAADDGSNHPRYDAEPAEIEAIERLLAADTASLGRRVRIEFAERRIATSGCLRCHARDRVAASWSTPMAPPVADQADDDSAGSGGFFRSANAPTGGDRGTDQRPPALTWAGEKLRSDWLANYIAGNAVGRPRPHLRVRMPVFAAHAELLAAGLHDQHGLSRSPPRPFSGAAGRSFVADELAAIGRDLVQAERLGCHSCHALGTAEALGGEGSIETIDLALARPRLRRSWFDRFLRDPQRFLPGTKMPRFVDEDGFTALYDVLDGDAERQFEAIWHYLGTLE